MQKLYYFEIEPSTPPSPFKEWQELTPGQCVEAIAHTALYDGLIELYVGTPTQVDTPLIGLIFQGGIYTGYGLGEEPALPLAREIDDYIGEPMIEFDGDAKVADSGPWLDVFTRYAAL